VKYFWSDKHQANCASHLLLGSACRNEGRLSFKSIAINLGFSPEFDFTNFSENLQF